MTFFLNGKNDVIFIKKKFVLNDMKHFLKAKFPILSCNAIRDLGQSNYPLPYSNYH